MDRSIFGLKETITFNLNICLSMELPFAESWKIKMIEPLRKSTRAEREQWLKEAHNNVFMLKAEQV